MKNLYLNTLLFLMEGKSGRFRVGLVPRAFIPFLVHPRVIWVFDRLPQTSRAAIYVKVAWLRVRKVMAYFVRRLLKDPQVVKNRCSRGQVD